ncbi:hypothetical protein [Bradyrhizobium sp. CCGE-LA001]|uniref:hypothetical protein n=1 Tax=Bradyrhizobium sp. CCGE-LA001 TaxID=1223566 RepID=UPI001198247C|nr:hypothetical protein [Bradyrhizobium sp. CCGE-LA001]
MFRNDPFEVLPNVVLERLIITALQRLVPIYRFLAEVVIFGRSLGGSFGRGFGADLGVGTPSESSRGFAGAGFSNSRGAASGVSAASAACARDLDISQSKSMAVKRAAGDAVAGIDEDKAVAQDVRTLRLDFSAQEQRARLCDFERCGVLNGHALITLDAKEAARSVGDAGQLTQRWFRVVLTFLICDRNYSFDPLRLLGLASFFGCSAAALGDLVIVWLSLGFEFISFRLYREIYSRSAGRGLKPKNETPAGGAGRPSRAGQAHQRYLGALKARRS